MSSCKEENDGDGEARDSVEGSTDMMEVEDRREGLLYLHHTWNYYVALALRKLTHSLLDLQSLHHSPMQTGFSLFVLRFGEFRICGRWFNRCCVDTSRPSIS